VLALSAAGKTSFTNPAQPDDRAGPCRGRKPRRQTIAMMHRTDLKWTLCRSGDADPDPVEFDSYGKAMEHLARQGRRCIGRDADVRVIFYDAEEADED
jgi:hypothetical protein